MLAKYPWRMPHAIIQLCLLSAMDILSTLLTAFCRYRLIGGTWYALWHLACLERRAGGSQISCRGRLWPELRFFIRREPGTGSSVVLVQTRALGGAGFLPGLGYVLARALG